MRRSRNHACFIFLRWLFRHAKIRHPGSRLICQTVADEDGLRDCYINRPFQRPGSGSSKVIVHPIYQERSRSHRLDPHLETSTRGCTNTSSDSLPHLSRATSSKLIKIKCNSSSPAQVVNIRSTVSQSTVIVSRSNHEDASCTASLHRIVSASLKLEHALLNADASWSIGAGLLLSSMQLQSLVMP